LSVVFAEMNSNRAGKPRQLYVVVDGEPCASLFARFTKFFGERQQVLTGGVLVSELHYVDTAAQSSGHALVKIRTWISDQ